MKTHRVSIFTIASHPNQAVRAILTDGYVLSDMKAAEYRFKQTCKEDIQNFGKVFRKIFEVQFDVVEHTRKGEEEQPA